MKRIWKSLLVLAVFCLFSLGTAADEQIRVYLDGKKIAFDTPPTIINDNTLVPMRAVFEALGAEVQWNDEKQCVTANRYDTEIKLFVGQNGLYRNYLYKYMPCPSQLINDRVYVPVRAIAESFGCHVDWCEESNAVAIFTESMSSRIYNTMHYRTSLSNINTMPYDFKDIFSVFLEKGADKWDLSKIKLLIPNEYTPYFYAIDDEWDNRYIIADNDSPEIAEYYRNLVADSSASVYEAWEINGFSSIKVLREFYAEYMAEMFFDKLIEPEKQTAEQAKNLQYFEYGGKLYKAFTSSQFWRFTGGAFVCSDSFIVNTIDETGFTATFKLGAISSGEFDWKVRYIFKNGVPFMLEDAD